MQNLEQIRARNALVAANGSLRTENDGEVVKKVPATIRTNGLLAAAAFASEKGGGHEAVFAAIITHLADKDVAILREACPLKAFIAAVSQADAAKLRAITAEAMAYLNYLRRFARRGDA